MSLKDFQILAKLGEGAYSSVYKVRRVSDSSEYALKKVKLINLSDKEKQNALNEVRILASIRHPNIIQYKEAFLDEQSNSLCIIMEYANNGDLFQKIVEFQKKGQLFPEQDIWAITIQVIKGLKALHDLKIFHRDLKSANVFLNKDGSVKLGDMNVSKVAKKGLLYTQTGTPYYASPEVWKDQPYDSKSDIWSLGCVIYEMTTLKPPFRAEDMEGLYKKVIRGYYPRIPPHFSQDLANVIRALLQVSPHLRPSCEKVLTLPAILKRMNESHLTEVDEGVPFLLNTIRIPKNLHYITDRLPKPNYQPLKLRKVDRQRFIQTLAGLQNVTVEVADESCSPEQQKFLLPKINSKKQSQQVIGSGAKREIYMLQQEPVHSTNKHTHQTELRERENQSELSQDKQKQDASEQPRHRERGNRKDTQHSKEKDSQIRMKEEGEIMHSDIISKDNASHKGNHKKEHLSKEKENQELFDAESKQSQPHHNQSSSIQKKERSPSQHIQQQQSQQQLKQLQQQSQQIQQGAEIYQVTKDQIPALQQQQSQLSNEQYPVRNYIKKKHAPKRSPDPDLLNLKDKYDDINKSVRADSVAQKNLELGKILDIHQLKYESPQHYDKYQLQQIYSIKLNKKKLDQTPNRQKSKNKYNILDIEGAIKPLQMKQRRPQNNQYQLQMINDDESDVNKLSSIGQLPKILYNNNNLNSSENKSSLLPPIQSNIVKQISDKDNQKLKEISKAYRINLSQVEEIKEKYKLLKKIDSKYKQKSENYNSGNSNNIQKNLSQNLPTSNLQEVSPYKIQYYQSANQQQQ